MKELQGKTESGIAIPKGYEIVYGGQYENLERAGNQLPLTLIMVIVFVFMPYKKLITTSCLLFAMAGGIIALLIRGYYFNVLAGVGFVSILGISIMAGYYWFPH